MFRVLSYVKLGLLKQFVADQIDKMTLESAVSAYHGSISMNIILPQSLVQNILQFGQLKRNNAVCKIWNELDARNVTLHELYIQRIWDMVPTDQQELFDYELDWEEIEKANISKKMRKWTTDWWETFIQQFIKRIRVEPVDSRDFWTVLVETMTNATITLVFERHRSAERLVGVLKAVEHEICRIQGHDNYPNFVFAFWRQLVFESILVKTP